MVETPPTAARISTPFLKSNILPPWGEPRSIKGKKKNCRAAAVYR
jgi:hypothetical protein